MEILSQILSELSARSDQLLVAAQAAALGTVFILFIGRLRRYRRRGSAKPAPRVRKVRAASKRRERPSVPVEAPVMAQSCPKELSLRIDALEERIRTLQMRPSQLLTRS